MYELKLTAHIIKLPTFLCLHIKDVEPLHIIIYKLRMYYIHNINITYVNMEERFSDIVWFISTSNGQLS